MTPPEMYSPDAKIHIDMKSEMPIIKSCETVDLQYEQEIVELPDIHVRDTYEQEDRIKEEISDMTLP